MEDSTAPATSTVQDVAEAVVAADTADVTMTEAADTPVKKEEKEEESPKAAAKTQDDNTNSPGKGPLASKLMEELPKNRFELELEFVQSLASPAYLHYLATNPSSDDHNWLDDPEFVEFLRYTLKVWSRPEYNRFLVYPQALYFLEWLLNHRREEWAQIGFRNFAHQQQFHAWQHRAERLYGRGSTKPVHHPHVAAGDPDQQQQQGPTLDPQTGLEVDAKKDE